MFFGAYAIPPPPSLPADFGCRVNDPSPLFRRTRPRSWRRQCLHIFPPRSQNSLRRLSGDRYRAPTSSPAVWTDCRNRRGDETFSVVVAIRSDAVGTVAFGNVFRTTLLKQRVLGEYGIIEFSIHAYVLGEGMRSTKPEFRKTIIISRNVLDDVRKRSTTNSGAFVRGSLRTFKKTPFAARTSCYVINVIHERENYSGCGALGKRRKTDVYWGQRAGFYIFNSTSLNTIDDDRTFRWNVSRLCSKTEMEIAFLITERAP